MAENLCSICEMLAETYPASFDGVHQKCPRCGEFKLSGSLVAALMNRTNTNIAKLSGWIRNQNRNGIVPKILTNEFQIIADRPIPTPTERADCLLSEAIYTQSRLGGEFYFDGPRFVGATYSQDMGEVEYLAEMLIYDDSLMKGELVDSGYKVLPKGYARAMDLTPKTAQSDKVFVAMWFDEKLEDVYEKGFHKGIVDAGYHPIRVDRIDHVNRIDDEIINQINQSAFIVADFTGHRGGVYFEAGYALGIGIPIVWTCRKDCIEDLHFDIRQYNTIDWEPERHTEFAKRLENRIRNIPIKKEVFNK